MVLRLNRQRTSIHRTPLDLLNPRSYRRSSSWAAEAGCCRIVAKSVALLERSMFGRKAASSPMKRRMFRPLWLSIMGVESEIAGVSVDSLAALLP